MNVIDEAAFEQHQTLADDLERGLDTSSLTDLGYSDASVELADKLGSVEGAGSMPVTETGQLVMTFEPEEEDWYISPVSIEARAIGLRGVLRAFAKQNSSFGMLRAVNNPEHAPKIENRIGPAVLHSIVLPGVKRKLNPRHVKAQQDFANAGGYDPSSRTFYTNWSKFNEQYLGPENAGNREAYEKTLDETAILWATMRTQSETLFAE